jgi:hypothetical protein
MEETLNILSPCPALRAFYFALKIFVVITASVKLFFVVPVLFQVNSELFPTLSLNSSCILRIRFV